MKQPDKLTVEEVESYLRDCQTSNFEEMLLRQLADTMREKERLRELIREISEDYATAAKPWNRYRGDLENRMLAAINPYKDIVPMMSMEEAENILAHSGIHKPTKTTGNG